MNARAGLNHFYRHVWSQATQSWHVAPETAKRSRKGGRNRSVSAVVGAVGAFVLSAVATLTAAQQAPPINQLPVAAAVAKGSATVSQNSNANSAVMNVNQSSQRAVIDWQSFNVGKNAQVNFNQPSASAVTLNNIKDQNPSQIYGQIRANGQVFLSNPNGILFSPTASVDVGGLVATTHGMDADAFMSGCGTFVRGNATGSIINQGELKASLGGYIALLAPHVQNAGVVIAQSGTVAMASGEMVTLNLDGQGGMAGITTTPSAIASLIENKLAVHAPDGQIILSAIGLNQLQAGVINNSGILAANSLTTKGGKIVLEADNIALTSTSNISATGASGGGTVLVGGGWQGNGEIRSATSLTMAPGASIDASATGNGNAGTIVLWSDVANTQGQTVIGGTLKAEGGPNGGDGGQIETSGHYLNVNQLNVSTRTISGNSGTWLIDPSDVTIGSSADANYTVASPNYTTNAGSATSYINVGTLATALGAGSVTVMSSNGTSGAGNITLVNDLSWSANTNLTLSAYKGININATMTIGGSSGGLILKTNQGGTGGDYSFGLTSAGFAGKVNYTAANVSSAILQTQNGTAGTVLNYTLVNNISSSSPIFNSNTSLTSATNFALTQDVDAVSFKNSGTNYANVRAGTYNGIFTGLGHTISNLSLGSGSNSGFFNTGAATIRDIGFASANITGTSNVGVLMGSTTSTTNLYNVLIQNSTVNGSSNYVGSLIGYAPYGGTLNNAFTTNTTVNGTGYVGGIIGYNALSASNLQYSGRINATSGNVGGIFGYSNSTILDTAQFNGNLTGGSYSGGILGQLYANTAVVIGNLTSQGSMNLTSASGNIGGVIGYLYINGYPSSFSVNFNNVNSSIQIGATTGNYTGGLIGNISTNYTSPTVNITSSNYSGINLSGASYVGGLIGGSSNYVSFNNTFSNFTGTVNGTSYVGGLLGSGTASITNSYATVSAVNGTSYVGGLAGSLSGSITNSYFVGNIAATSEYGGLAGQLLAGNPVISNSFYNVNATNFTVNGTSSGGLLTPGGVFSTQWNEWVNSNANLSQRRIANNLTTTTIGNLTYYQLGSVSDFSTLLGLSEYNTGYRFVLTSNISLSGSATPYIPYLGATEFHGNGFTISDSAISRQTSGLGLFGYVYGTNLHDLNISTGPTTANVICGTSYVGSLAGAFASGTITNVNATINANITGTTSTGGLIGCVSYSNISNANVTLNANVSGSSYTGGLIGYAAGSTDISTLSNLTISSSSPSYVVNGSANTGGAIGYDWLYRVNNITSTVAVNATGSTVGGLIGYVRTESTGTAISDSRSTGNITTTAGVGTVGGLVGNFYSYYAPTSTPNIVNSTSSSNMTTSGSYIGGLVGCFSITYSPTTVASVSSSSFTGNLSNASGNYIGGLIGYSNAYVVNSTVATTNLNASLSSYVGGLIGYSNQNISNSSFTATNLTTTGNYVGGAVGYQASSTITNVTVNSNVGTAGSTQNYIGGLVGYISAGNLSASTYASGSVAGGSYVGGLVGGTARNTAGIVINTSTTSQNVTATNDFAGGLVGLLGGTLSNSNYTLNATVGTTVTGRNDVGGLVGRLNDTGCISSAFANGSINAAINYGGIVGHIVPGGTLSNAYYDIDAVQITGISPTSAGNRTLVSGGGVGGPRLITAGAIYSGLYTQWMNGGAMNGINATSANGTFSKDANGTYIISNNVTDLNNYLGFAQQTNLNFTLGADIDLASLPGYYVPYVGGRFNPNSKVVSNLTLSQYTSNLGFLGYVNGATNNQTITALKVLNGSITGKTNLGLAVGSAYAITLNTPQTTGSVNGSDITYTYTYDPSEIGLTATYGLGMSNAGGVLGFGYASSATNAILTGSARTNSVTNATVTGGSNTGGVAGRIYNGVVSNLASAANVTGTANSTGGLIGRMNNGCISSANTTGEVVGNGTATGGLVGCLSSSTVVNATTTGNVTGNNTYTGGLIGWSDTSTSNFTLVSHSTGLVKGTSAVGGLVGCLSGSIGNTSLAAYDSTVNSNVQGNGSGIGGLVGYVYQGNISNAQYVGNVGINNTIGTYIGGLVGCLSASTGTIQNNNISANVTGLSQIGGLAGYSNGGTVANNTVSGNITGSNSSIGGLIGYVINGGTATNNTVAANVTGGSTVGGMIGSLSGITISTSSFTGNVSGSSSVGGYVGSMAYGTVNASSTSATVNATSTSSGGFIGAMSGGNVTNSTASGTLLGNMSSGGFIGSISSTPTYAVLVSNDTTSVNVTGTAQTGGFIGNLNQTTNTITMNNSSATGTVIGTSNVGGYAGLMVNATVSNLSASGNVSQSSNNSSVGGFAGFINNMTISASSASGAVTGYQDAGGFVGQLTGTTTNISTSSASGNVTNTTNGTTSRTGGFVGYFNTTNNNATIVNSRASGIVSGTTYVGGFAGYVTGNGAISNSYETGAVIASNSSSGGVGGFAGYLDSNFNGTISNIYEMGSVKGQGNLGGLIGYAAKGNVSNGYVTGLLMGNGSNVGAVFGGLNISTYVSGNTTPYYVNRSNLYYDNQTTNLTVDATGGGGTGNIGAAGLTTAVLQGALPSGFTATPWATGTGLFPYLNTIYTVAPSAIYGIAYLADGTTAVNAKVGLYGGGKLLNGGLVTTGADGSFYEIVSSGVVFGSSNFTVNATAKIAATLTPNGTSYVSGMLYSDAQPFANNSVNLSNSSATGNLTQGLSQWTTTALSSAQLNTDIITNTIGTANYAAFSSNVSNSSSLILKANGASFNLNTSLAYANTELNSTSNAGFINITSVGNLTLSGVNITSTKADNITAPSIILGAASTNNITTSSANITLNGALLGTGNLTLNTSGAGNVTFQNTIGNASTPIGNLAINSTGVTTFNGTIDAANLTTDAGGSTQFNAARATTTGNQVYLDNLLTANATVLTGSAITFGSPVNASNNLTVNGNLSLNANVTSTGFQTYTGQMLVGTNATLTAGGGITLAKVDSANATFKSLNFVLNNNSPLTLSGNIGTQNALATLTASADTTNIGTSSDVVIDTSSDILFSGNVQLARSANVLTSTGAGFGGNFTVQGNLSSTTAKDLILDTGAGTANLNTNLTGLGNLTVTGSNLTLGNVSANGTVTLSPATSGNLTGVLSGSAALTKGGAGTLTLRSADTYSGNTTVNSGVLVLATSDSASTSTVFVNAGGALDVSNLTLSAPNITLSGGQLQISTGNATIASPITLSANSTLKATGGELNVTSALNTGVYGLALAGTGDFTLGNASNTISLLASGSTVNSISVNNSVPLTLGNLTLNATTYSGLDSTNNITVNNTGTITFASGTSSASSAGNINLIATKFINNAGSTALSVSSPKFWRLWSTNANPFDLTNGDQLSTLVADFTQYNAPYGTTALGTGNGTFYTITPQIDLQLTGTISKIYDGTATAQLVGSNIIANGTVNGDTIATVTATNSAFTSNGTGTSIESVGTNKTVTATGLNSVVATSLLGKPVYGYILQTANATGVGEITPAPLTLNISKTYDATAGFTLTNNYTLVGVAPIDVNTNNVGLSGDATVSSANAGNYTSFVTNNFAITNANYSLNAVNAKINPAPLTYTVANATSTYGTLATLGASTLTGILSADTANVTATVSAVGANGTVALVFDTPAGNYTQQVTTLGGSAANNYQIANAGNSPGLLTIERKALNYVVTDATSTYGVAPVLGNLTLSGVLPSDAANVLGAIGTLAGNGTAVNVAANMPAGNYTQMLTSLNGSAATNYQIANTGNTLGILNVQPATLTYAVANATSTYGNSPTLGSVNFTGLYAGDVVNATMALTNGNGSVSIAANTPAGNYTQQVAGITGSLAGNYLLATNGNTFGTLTVQPATLTYTIANATSTYGNLPSLGNVTFTGLYATDTVTPSVGISQGNASVNITTTTPAGNYTQQVTGISGNLSSNYQLASVGNTLGTLNVQPATLTYAVANTTSTYGTTPSTGNMTLSGIVASDIGNVTGTVSTLGANGTVSLVYNTPVGNYSQQVTSLGGSAAANYQLASSGNSNGTLTVTPATLTFAVANATSIYGTTAVLGNLTLTGVLPVDSANVNGTVAAFDGNGSIPLVANTPAGNYPQQVTNLTGSAASNYQLATSGNTLGILNVQPKTLTYSVANATSTYGTTPTLGNVNFNGLYSGDVVNATLALSNANGTVSIAANTPAGNYTQQVSALTGNLASNYQLALAGNTLGTLNVQPAALTITANSVSKTFGQSYSLSSSAFSTTGLVAGDTISAVVQTASGGTAVLDNVGTYSITPSNPTGNSFNANNYAITYQNGTLTVSPLAVNLSGRKNFDGTTALSLLSTGSSLTVANAVNGAPVTVTGTAGLASSNSGNVSVSQFNGLTLDNPNYTLAGAQGTVNVLSVSQINLQSLTNSEISNLISSQLANLTSNQLGNLSSAQLQLFTPALLTAISPSQMSGLSASQLSSLSAAQVAGMSSGQLSILTPQQLSGITADQISNLSPAQLQALTPAQLSNLDVQQVAALSPVQLASLSNAQLQSLSGGQVAGLSPTQLASLSAPQVAVISALGNFSSNQIAQLSPAQLNVVSTTQLSQLQSNQLASLTLDQLESLSVSQIAALAPSALSGLAPAQVTALSALQVQSLTPNQLASLSPSQLNNFSGTQLQSLSSQQIASLSAQQLGAIDASQISFLSPNQIQSISPQQLPGLRLIQVASLGPNLAQSLTVQQLRALSTIQIATLTSSVALTIEQINALPASSVAALSPQLIASLSSVDISAINPVQLQSMRPDQLSSLNAQQMSGLSTEQMSALNGSQLRSLSIDQLTTLSLAQVKALSSTQLSLLTAPQLAALNKLLAAQEKQTSPTTGTTVAIALESAKQDTPAQSATLEPINNLTGSQVRALSDEQVQALTPGQISILGPVQIKSLTSTQIASMTTEQANSLSPSQISMMGPAQIVALPDLQPVLANADVYVFSHSTSTVSAGVLPIAVLGASHAQSVAVQFRQESQQVTLRVTKSENSINAAELKIDGEPQIFLVTHADGNEVQFGGVVADGHLVISAGSDLAKELALNQLPAVIAAAVTSLGESSRVTINDLKGVLLDLR